jgi:hypothetical protein
MGEGNLFGGAETSTTTVNTTNSNSFNTSTNTAYNLSDVGNAKLSLPDQSSSGVANLGGYLPLVAIGAVMVAVATIMFGEGIVWAGLATVHPAGLRPSHRQPRRHRTPSTSVGTLGSFINNFAAQGAGLSATQTATASTGEKRACGCWSRSRPRRSSCTGTSTTTANDWLSDAADWVFLRQQNADQQDFLARSATTPRGAWP